LEDKTNSGAWAQIRGGTERFYSDENSIEDYIDNSIGIMFGFDRFINGRADLMWGAYARINKDNIEQGESDADGLKTGLGLYGGFIKDFWELKSMLLGSYDKFDTHRYVLGNVADASFNTLTFSWDLEAALKFAISAHTKLKPFAGVEVEYTNYGEFSESGGGIYNLDVEAGNYLRSAARIGAGVDYVKNKWILYGHAEGKILMTGGTPEIENKFSGTDLEFKTRGAEEGIIGLGIGAGAEYRLARSWKLFANGRFFTASDYLNIFGNVGARYLFGQVSKEEIKAKKEAKAKIRAAKVEAAKIAQAKKKEEAELKAQEERAKKIAQEEAANAERIAKANETAKLNEKIAAEKAETQARLEAQKEENKRLLEEKAAAEAKLAAEKAAAEELAAQIKKQKEETLKAEALKRMAEEAKIKQEISDAELAKKVEEAKIRRKTEMKKTFTLTLNFPVGGYFLTDEGREKIGRIADEIKTVDYKKISIEGHTDNTGGVEINKRLSRQRARSIYDELVKNGIEAEKMSYQGYAATMPVDTNNTPEGRAKNRRAQVFVE